MRILQHKTLAGREDASDNYRVSLRCAATALAALKCDCEYPGRYLYNALTHLSKIKNSGINIGLYDHLYFSTEATVPQADLEFAESKFRELSQTAGVICHA